MKKIFLIFVVFSLFVFAGCGGSSKKTNNTDSGETVTDEDGDTADEEPADDTEPAGDTTPDSGDSTDSGDSGDPADSGDSADDSGDSAPDEDADTDTADTGENEPHPCAKCSEIENSNGKCTVKENNTYECGCIDRYFWNGTLCEQYKNEDIKPVPEEQSRYVGYPCDPDEFVEFCDENNRKFFCEDEKIRRTDCGEQTCLTTIGLYGDKSRNHAGCYNACETVGEDTKCKNPDLKNDFKAGGTVINNSCRKTSKGNLYFEALSFKQCDTPCNSAGTGCIPLAEVPSTQDNTYNAVCDPETFVEFCDEENKAFYCEAGYVNYMECSTDHSCLVTIGRFGKDKSRNYVDCYTSCEEEGMIKTPSCSEKNYSEFSLGYLKSDFCLETSKGKLWFSNLVFEQCDTPCASDGKSCVALDGFPETPDAPEYQSNASCNQNTFTEFCDGETAVYCFGGSVARKPCADYGQKCLTTKGISFPNEGNDQSKNFVNCYDSCEESWQECKPQNSASFINSHVCAETSRGPLDIVVYNSKKCSNGCTEDGLFCQFQECGASTTSFPCYDSASKLTWSDKTTSGMQWGKAIKHCEDLNESKYGGYDSGWHLPTISELRTLIKKCQGTIATGGCNVRDEDTSVCLTSDCQNAACYSCDIDADGGYSKFQDTNIFSSKSTNSTNGTIWFVDFKQGLVDFHSYDSYDRVRCVR